MEINPVYLNSNLIKEVLEKEGVVTLFDFLINIKLKKPTLKLSKNPVTHSYSSANFNLQKPLPEFLESITDSPLHSSKIYQFKHKDYIILNDATNPTSTYEVIIDLTKDWDLKHGGQVIYIHQGDSIRVPLKYNSVTIVKRENFQKYVKYVNYLAKNHKRTFLIMEF